MPVEHLAAAPSAVLGLGGVAEESPPTVDERVVMMECTSDEQSASFQRLLRFRRGEFETFDLFEEFGCDGPRDQ
jgi:hypothetical protein